MEPREWAERANIVQGVIRRAKRFERGVAPRSWLDDAEVILDQMQTALLEMRDQVELARYERAGG